MQIKIINPRVDQIYNYKGVEWLPNRLTPLYFKNYYKEENYLTIEIEVLIYLTPPYSNG